MPTKQEDGLKSTVSPVLFMTSEGEPMPFFLRPGPLKRNLQPLITAGGGMLCNVQQPGAILLIDPKEKGSIPESAAHWYVSTQYIHDCIEKGEQLDLKDYKLEHDGVRTQSARLTSSKESSPRLSGGRVAYTPEDDAAILKYVSKHKTGTGGNRLWQEMEKQRVTNHSWQSMRSRYKVQLAKQSHSVQVETSEDDDKAEAEEKTEVEGNQETDDQMPPSDEDTPPQEHSAEADLTQIDDQSIPPENIDAQASISLQEEEQHVDELMDEQPAEKSDSPQTKEPCADQQTDTSFVTAKTSESERDGSQTAASPQKQSVEDSPPSQPESPPSQPESLPSQPESPPSQPESLPKPSTSKKAKEKQKASPMFEPPQRPLTRRRLVLEASSSREAFTKKLRSASTQAERATSSLKPPKNTKSAGKSTLPIETADQPPPKKARRKTGTPVTRSQQEEGGDSSVSETAQADQSQKAEKRPLRILELATKEFEDRNESGDGDTPTEPVPSPSDAAADPASPQSDPEPEPEPEPSSQENIQEPPASTVPQTACPEPAAAEPVVPKAVVATSKAHLFIFDSESQVEESQSALGEGPAASSNPHPTGDAASLCLTQVQLEEDMQRIRELMKQTDQDLVSVTKALLKTSGDFSAALDLLLNPSSVPGPFWNREDDSVLLSADPVSRQCLQEKYSEEEVAKRMVFLEVEG